MTVNPLMADIDITHSHTLGQSNGRTAVEQVAQELQSDLGIDYQWNGDTLEFDGSGADGHIEVEEEVVQVAINLSMFLRPMSEQVRSEAEEYLERHL